MIIRNEEEKDYRIVEEMIKKAFWNLSVPGCNEHYFAHQVRESEDYIPELDFVIEEDGKIVAYEISNILDIMGLATDLSRQSFTKNLDIITTEGENIRIEIKV